jgi:hypothetical protein
MITGLVDFYDGAKVFGWAIDEADLSKVVSISVLSDGVQIAVAAADIYRQDLAAAGFGDGKHSFEITLPTWVRSIRHLVFVARVGDEPSVTLRIETEIDRLIADAILQTTHVLAKDIAEMGLRMSAHEVFLSDLESKLEKIERSASDPISALKKTIEDNDVFIVRLDERLSKLESALSQKKRKRIFGIF